MTIRTLPPLLFAVLTGFLLSPNPALGQNSTIDSLTGQVTANEVSSFKSAIANLTPGGSNSGNNYAYGNGGDAMEACADMYDITKDRSILDKLIQYCDKVVSIRNTNRVMWTGLIDPVWPNSSTTTWGCEQGDVAGHLAYCAQLIAENPALWDTPVGIGDNNSYGPTYKGRAQTYLAVVDTTMELFYTNNFIHTNEYMQTPPTPPWPDPNSANDAVPWNQVSMVCAPLIRAADAHSRFGDASPEIAKFRKTAQASIDRFFVQANTFRSTRNGKTVCKWSYSGGFFAPGSAIRYTEDTAHGGYDITQIHRTSHWLPGTPVALTNANMIADTLMEVIKTNTQFWSRVDGTGTLSGGMKNSWTYLAEWRADVFAATAHTGSQYYADAARKLWIKNALTNGWPDSVSLGLNLPDAWLDVDIGKPDVIGSAAWTNGTFTLRGSGADIGPTDDQCNYTHKSVLSDFTLFARVTSLANTHAAAKAGIMARSGTGSASPFVSLAVTPSSGLSMQYRASTNGAVVTLTNFAAITAPRWLKLTRAGDTFTGYQSVDGTNWILSGAVTLSLTNTTVGLAVSSHSNASLNTATFDQVNLAAIAFTVDINPSTVTVGAGSNTVGTVSITPINGFNTNVTLSLSGLPAHVGAVFNPATANPSQTSTLTLTATNNALPGAYLVTLTGTSGALVISVPVYLMIVEPPPSADTQIVCADNAWVKRSESTTVEDPSETLQAKRLADNNTRLFYVRFNLGSFLGTHSLAGITQAKLRLSIPSATSGAGTLNVYGLVDNPGGVSGSDAGWSSISTTWNNQPAKSASPNDIPNSSSALPNTNTTAVIGSAGVPGTAGEFDITFNLSAFTNFLAADSNGQVTFLFVNTSSTQVNFASQANTGGYLQPTLEILAPVTDFSASASPAEQTVAAGTNAVVTVSITGTNGFDDIVTLDANLPAGITAAFNPPSITGTGSSTLTLYVAADVEPDIYVIPVTASNGTDVRNATVTLTVIGGDSDGDGIPDAWTQQYFGHPTGQAGDSSRATDDADGDGLGNLAEYLCGTDPTDPSSCLRLLGAGTQGNDRAIVWSAVGGIGYRVQVSTNLTTGFADISPMITPGTNGAQMYLDIGAATNSTPRFYRIRLAP